jgi:hypothetical protein
MPPYSSLWYYKDITKTNQLTFTILADHMLVSEKYWRMAQLTICWSLCIYLVQRCRKLSKANIFCYMLVYWEVLWFWEPAITSWYTTISIYIKFCKRECWKSEVSVSFWSHMQSREGSCSQLSGLRSEDILVIASFITSEVINPVVCCICLFPRQS